MTVQRPGVEPAEGRSRLDWRTLLATALRARGRDKIGVQLAAAFGGFNARALDGRKRL